jgi:hypothetical protein
MIAFNDRAIQFPNAFHAFSRIGVIADHITQAYKTRAFARARISQHRLQRLEISVNIAENCKPHRLSISVVKKSQLYNEIAETLVRFNAPISDFSLISYRRSHAAKKPDF